jgi:hypothetical protein
VRNRILRIGAAASLAGIAVATSANFASADSSTLLSAYQGDWRGNGEARPNPHSDPMRVSCKISAVFDSAKVALFNKGRCGSTQGSRNLNGKLEAAGDGITGDFFGGTATQDVVNQRLRVVDGMIVSEAEMENAGKMWKLRTFLTAPKDGAFLVQSQFYDHAAKSWVVAGEIEFRKQ